ncbi:MAG: hypothetical protein IJF52_04085 [Clostridia bacterium]|nr:hypothetical protein [Clostridia bacterium]
MNNDIEKDLPEVNSEEVTEEVNGEVSEEVVAEQSAQAEETSESAERCVCDCEGCEACASFSEEEFAQTQTPKKRKIVTPIIIAAAAFVLVAAVVFGGVWIYNAFFGASLKGVWMEKGYEDSGIYFEFDGNGNVYLRGGGISYFGNYETATYDTKTAAELPQVVTKVIEAEGLSGKVNVLTTDFYMFGMYGGEYIYSTENIDGNKALKLKFVDTTGTVSEWTFVKSKLPEFTMDPTVITNASADEAGIDTLVTDKNILGTWSEADYGTYTFYDDGTAHYKTKYQIDQTYSMFYGITMGYGVDLDFRYTVGDGKIYMSVDYFTGESNDGVMTYYLDGKNLVIDGVGYAKAEN